MIFTHTFNDDSWVVNTATGWHRYLDVLAKLSMVTQLNGMKTRQSCVKSIAMLLIGKINGRI